MVSAIIRWCSQLPRSIVPGRHSLTARQHRATFQLLEPRRYLAIVAKTHSIFSSVHPAGLLAPQQAAKLDQLVVRWYQPLTASEERWATCFAHLVAFARRHGHCQVNCQGNPLLLLLETPVTAEWRLLGGRA